jgi:L-2,4-diaminobutyrate transaminase
MILDRAPANMSKVYFGQSGSDANETNIKLIWYYNNMPGALKEKIISRWRSYHRSGLMTGSLTGLELFHNKFDLPLSQVILYRSALLFPALLIWIKAKQRFVAAWRSWRAESRKRARTPLQRSSGEPCSAPEASAATTDRLPEHNQTVLKKHDILLIADEVVTGFGRLGMFGSEHYGMEPDIITILRVNIGLRALCLVRSYRKMWKRLANKGTDENGAIGMWLDLFCPSIGAAAGVAGLKLIDDLNLIENARHRWRILFTTIIARGAGRHPMLETMRSEGMFITLLSL